MSIIKDSDRIINGMTHKVLTVDGYDRIQINSRLQDLIAQRDKIQDKIDTFMLMSDMMDHEIEMRERGDSAQNLFDQMFGGWLITMYVLKLVNDQGTIMEEFTHSFADGVTRGTEIANLHQHRVFIVPCGHDHPIQEIFPIHRILPNKRKWNPI